MTATFTKAQARGLLTAAELKLFEESRAQAIRQFTASQLDRRVIRMRALRDKARDLLQRQRVALQEKTGSKRGAGGTANQQRSKDKVALVTDMLRRFEAQLKVTRKNEKAGIVAKGGPKRRVTRKAAIAKVKAPDGDFTAARMRAQNTIDDEAGQVMKARKRVAKKAAKTTATSAASKRSASTTKKATTNVSARRKAVDTAAAAAPVNTLPGGETQGKRTRAIKAVQGDGSAVQPGFANARAHNTAQQRKFQAALLTPIHAHISSRGRRSQGKRDSRG